MGLTLNDRKVIAERWADGDSAAAIARRLDRTPGAIYPQYGFYGFCTCTDDDIYRLSP